MSNANLHLVDSSAASPVRKSKSASSKRSAKSKTKPEKRPTLARDVMSSPAVCCRASDTLNTAAQLMWDNDIGAVVVVNDQLEPTSVVTDRDVSMASYTQGVPLFFATVEGAMSKNIVSCTEETPVDELRARMIEGQLRRIPVTDSRGQLAGIIGLADLIREANGPLRKGCRRGTSAADLQKLTGALYSPDEKTLKSRR